MFKLSGEAISLVRLFKLSAEAISLVRLFKLSAEAISLVNMSNTAKYYGYQKPRHLQAVQA